MKVNKKVGIGFVVFTVIIMSVIVFFYFIKDRTPLYEIAENIEFSMMQDEQNGYVLLISNNSQSAISSCSVEIYNKNIREEGSKSIFTNNNFKIKAGSNVEIKVGIHFDESHYLHFHGYRGFKLKKNRFIIEGALDALTNTPSP